MKLLKALAVILLFCGTGFAQGKSLYSTTVEAPAKKLKSARANSKRKSSYEKISAVTVSGQAYGLGKFSARFGTRKNVTWTATVSRSGTDSADATLPTLLQGEVSVKGGWQRDRNMYPAAASIIGNTATVEFPGRAHGSRASRQRMYRIRFVVANGDRVQARVSAIPSSAFGKKSCESLGHRSTDGHVHSRTIEPMAQAAGAERTVRVATLSTVADPAWYAQFGEESNAQIAAIVNSAEAIYERQVGIRFQIVKQHVYSTSAPFTTDIAGELLGQFAKNAENPSILGSGSVESFDQEIDLKHLFTGGELYKDATRTSVTTGIAFTSALCWSPDYAYGVTKRNILTSVTFAHEIGHNLGASHDPADPNGIMYTYIRPNSYLSGTSVSQITSHVNAFGSCLTTESAATDLSTAKLAISANVRRRSRTATIQGALISADGSPIGGEVVTIFIGAKPVNVTTDANGAFSHTFSRRIIKGRSAKVSAQTEQGETKAAEVLTVTRF